MKKNILVSGLLAVLALSLAPKQARAGLLLEPYLGYGQGSAKAESSAIGNLSFKNDGVVIGARIAYTLPLLFWFGVDYAMQNGKFKPDAGADGDWKSSDLYAVAGVDFPILVRGWVGYGLMNDTTISFANGDSKIKGGTNLKAGLGFTFLPMLSVNVELYQKNNATLDSIIGQTVPFDSYKDSGFALSVSLPFDI